MTERTAWLIAIIVIPSFLVIGNVLRSRAVRQMDALPTRSTDASWEAVSRDRQQAARAEWQRGRAVEDPEIAALMIRDHEEDGRSHVGKIWGPSLMAFAAMCVILLGVGVAGGVLPIALFGGFLLALEAAFLGRLYRTHRNLARSLDATQLAHPSLR